MTNDFSPEFVREVERLQDILKVKAVFSREVSNQIIRLARFTGTFDDDDAMAALEASVDDALLTFIKEVLE